MQILEYGINEVTKQIENVMKEELKIQALKGRVGKTIRVMVIGIPNVGKSSFINRISKKTSAGVGNKPGVTKQKQWIRLSQTIELLDTPGVLWPKFEDEKTALNLAYIGTIKDDVLEKTEIAFYLLKFLLENYREDLLKRYKISNEEIRKIEDIMKEETLNEQIMAVFYMIGGKRGAIISGGNIDEEKVASIILEDFRSGKLGRISLEKV